jgi:hypothetical protein
MDDDPKRKAAARKWGILLSIAVSMLVGGTTIYMTARDVIGHHIQSRPYLQDGLICGAIFGLLIGFVRHLALRWIVFICGAIGFSWIYRYFLLALIGI